MEIPFARSILGRLFSSVRMRKDWDLRARENARLYIDCGHGGSEEGFWRSGREDLESFVLRDIDVDASASALEIGCGMGRLVLPLSERIGQVTGVDISGEMIARGQEALGERSNVRLRRTDGDLSGTPDASVDLVYSHIVFQHIPSKRAVSRYFAETARVLRGGGLFRFGVDGRPARTRPADTWLGVRYDRVELERELAHLSFERFEVAGEGTQYMGITAQRRSTGGRPESRAVRRRPRSWDPQALDRLLAQLGCGFERERVLAGAVSIRALAEPLVATFQDEAPRDYVARLYRIFLDREPDEDGLAAYSGEIERGVHRTNVVDCLLASKEFDDRHRKPASIGSSHCP